MEQVLYRFTLVAAVLSAIFCAAVFVANVLEEGHGEERLLSAVFIFAAPTAILATFYIIRWIIAGRWTAKPKS